MDGARAMRLSAGFLIPFYGQVAGDGCSEMCQCEADPCDFAASPSVHLASVVFDGGMLRSGGCLCSREVEEEEGGGGLWSVGECWILVQTDTVTALPAGRRPKTRAKGLCTGSHVHPTRSGALVGRVRARLRKDRFTEVGCALERPGELQSSRSFMRSSSLRALIKWGLSFWFAGRVIPAAATNSAAMSKSKTAAFI